MNITNYNSFYRYTRINNFIFRDDLHVECIKEYLNDEYNGMTLNKIISRTIIHIIINICILININ